MDKGHFNRCLGTFVKQKRIKLKMSQSELAARLENNFQNVSRLERGEVSPTLFWFFKLAHAFQQEPTALLNEFENYLLEG